MKIVLTLLVLMTIACPAYAQTEWELGASFWQGNTTSSENPGSSSVGLGGWIAAAKNLSRASLRLDYFGIAQDCSGCGDADGLLLFLMLGRDIKLAGPLNAHLEGGPGFLRLGEDSGFGPRGSGTLQLRIGNVGVGVEVFVARSLGAERIRPAGAGVAGSVRF